MVKGVEDGVEQAHGRYRLQALIALRGGKSVAASAANTKRADTIRIYARVAFQEIHRGVHIVNTVRGLICLARLTGACALVRGIGSNRDVTLLRQALRIQARDLLFHAAVGVGDRNGGVGFRRIKIRRSVDVRGDFKTLIVRVGHRVNIDGAFLILGECAP